MIRWRTQYDTEVDEAIGDACATVYTEPSKTQEQFAKQNDVNEIVRRMGLTDGAVLPASLGIHDPRYYADLTDVPDLRSALDTVIDAQQKFAQLPAKVRARFDNRPFKLWEFVQDDENRPEAIRLGLLAEPPQAAPPPVPPPAP